jgi:N-acyl homoserine lactone hydrolase
MTQGTYETTILVQGYPGKTVCHGSLGWSTVALLRGHGRVALVDVGSFNVRKLLIDQLAALALRPDDVTDVLLSHAHWDHMVNWTMFGNARIAIGDQELDWSLEAPWGVTPVPELYVERLATWPRLERLQGGDEVLPGIRAMAAPGHTPGHLVYVLEGPAHDVIFTGDAAKNRAELLVRAGYGTGDAVRARESIDAIWSLWRARPDSVVVPGHDMPMVLDATQPSGVRYVAAREATIDAWLDESLEQTTTFKLSHQRLANDRLP